MDFSVMFRKIQMSKSGSKLCGCQNAQILVCFCDFGRKLENLPMPVCLQ